MSAKIFSVKGVGNLGEQVQCNEEEEDQSELVANHCLPSTAHLPLLKLILPVLVSLYMSFTAIAQHQSINLFLDGSRLTLPRALPTLVR